MPGSGSSNIVTDVITSQGNSPIAGATKASFKTQRGSGGSGSTKLDASTLALPHGSTRVYEDGLADAGPGASSNGLATTATIEGLGTPPALGSSLTWNGTSLKCNEVTEDDSVGELHKWTASYVVPADD